MNVPAFLTRARVPGLHFLVFVLRRSQSPPVFGCRGRGIRTTRGRPYRKNDQAFVEQKNGSVIRRWVGYDRYSSKAAFQL